MKVTNSASNVSTDKDNLINLAARKPLATSSITNSFAASSGNPVKPTQINFDRSELNAILRVYSFMVAAGEWRDYGIAHLKDRAVFSVFRKASEAPLFRIEKDPKLSRRQGAYAIINQNGMTLKRGHDLKQVLSHFDKKLRLVE